MKKGLILFALAISGKLFSQQYSTIVPGTDAWFNNNYDQVNAIHIDSVGVLGSDSLFWNYPVLRENQFTLMMDTVAPSWVGRCTSKKQNGDEIYFNSNLDSIIFKTYLPINATWKLYNFSNGDYIQAKISSINFQVVGPIADSVKTITLQQFNSSNQQIAGYYNGLSFAVSRSNGFTQLFDFYNFPFNPDVWKRVDAHRLFYGEVYNFNIGDQFQYDEALSQLLAPNPIMIRTVTGKNSWGQDSVQYIFYKEDYWFSVNASVVTTYYSAAPETLMVYNLDSMIFREYPGEPIHDFPNISSYDLKFEHIGNCRPLAINYVFWLYQFNPNIMNYPVPFEGVNSSREWIEGCGRVDGYTNVPNFYYWQYFMTYANTGNDSCGARVVLGIQNETVNPNSLSIFPNPVADQLSFSFESNNIGEVRYSISSLDGKNAIEKKFRKNVGINSLSISVSELESGIYFLILEDETGTHATKFIKN